MSFPRRLVVGALDVLEMMKRQGLVAEPLDWMRRLPPGIPSKAYSEGGNDE